MLPPTDILLKVLNVIVVIVILLNATLLSTILLNVAALITRNTKPSLSFGQLTLFHAFL
jgi:hypothetical protein